ncbi:hypothetical protein SEA_SAKAI_79 [Arthrobacter phage Sakai]|nr:hypothetical protein SEA_GORPY_80 [Arthrobacter phage Gorpy]UVK62026.1 hypothetical protein SEA_SAKAI_79 [Arthrobacter phage Sakai]
MKKHDHYKRFISDTEKHEMTILLDQDVYRHLRFKEPGTGMYFFDVITWPGNLTIRADMGTYTFNRLTDMFEFFGGREPGYVNEGYWAEKLVAVDKQSPAKEFDEDLFRQRILEDFWERREDFEPEDARTIWESIREQIFDDYEDRHDANACHTLLQNFRSPDRRFNYHDAWEWGSFDDYGIHFVWCLHAITHAIRTYREAKAAME